MKTIFEKTYMNKPMAMAAAAKELGEDWDRDYGVTRDDDKWIVRPVHSEERSMSEILSQYRATYIKTRTKDGRTLVDNGDEVAQALRAIDLDILDIIVDLLGNDLVGSHELKYHDLNRGQHRMCVGNIIRAKINKGESSLRSIKKMARQLVK